MSEVNLGDPLVSSMMVRDTFSQSNLTKLVDPRQNKILEETLNFREKTQCDNQLTMSILKREMSYKTVEDFPPFDDDVQFEVDGIKECSKEKEFHNASFEEPSSLKSLPDEKRLMMSDDSDALFHSAELDFSCSDGSPIKSPKSGKSSSSPITIQGISNSFRKLSARSLGYQNVAANEKGNGFSLPVLTTTDISKVDYLSTDSSNASMINCRSLSEAIKSTEVIQNIIDSADLVKIAKHEVIMLRKEFNNIRTDLVGTQNDFFNDLSDLKVCLSDMLSRGRNSCKNCRVLQEKLSLGNIEINKEIVRLKEQYLDVISEKDRIFMEHESLEVKLRSLTDENIKLKETVYNSETEMMRLKGELESGHILITDKNNKLSDLNMKISTLIKQVGTHHLEITDKNKELSGLSSEKGKLLEDLQRSHLEIVNRDTELSELHSVKDKLMKESLSTNDNLQKRVVEMEGLKHELVSVRLSCQLSNDKHIEQVSTSNVKVKELRRYEKEGQNTIKEQEQKINKLDNMVAERDRLLAEKEEQLSELLQCKDSLEAQNQTNFNFVLNKIRKDKDSQIHELKTEIKKFEKELTSYKHKNEFLNHEINVHKSAYSEIREQLDTEKDKCSQYELSISQHGDIFAENDRLKLEVIGLKDSMESAELRIQKMKQYEEDLKNEKASVIISREIDKECNTEEYGKSETVIRRAKSTSIE